MKQYFQQFGAVKSVFVLKNECGKSRGFGFVTFSDIDAADKVCGKIHMSLLKWKY